MTVDLGGVHLIKVIQIGVAQEDHQRHDYSCSGCVIMLRQDANGISTRLAGTWSKLSSGYRYTVSYRMKDLFETAGRVEVMDNYYFMPHVEAIYGVCKYDA